MEVRISVVGVVESTEVRVEFNGKVCGIRCNIFDRKWT